MANDLIKRWIDTLGYAGSASLHCAWDKVSAGHAYAPELRALLASDGLIKAKAVFDVDGVPTVCFIDPSGKPADWIEGVRQRIWNQNLVTIVLVIEDQRLTARPVLAHVTDCESVTLTQASAQGILSASDIQSGDIWERHHGWFDSTQRVDEQLLDNIGIMVKRLTEDRLDRSAAQFLLGQTLFVSYLEHRGIVGDVYRERHRVGRLHDLIAAQDRDGLKKLFSQLKTDFNGDFLDSGVAERAGWASLSQQVFIHLNDFLSRVDLRTGQHSLWNYDFRFIPVELLSGIYESFLGDEQEELGAYYTPRHLANMVVDLAFSDSDDPTMETVYDGACGSGILLTTAFRRMLEHARAARRGNTLPLVERINLLTTHIFGGDVSEPACRVTAFSLYLSLLEDLVPSDIVSLTEDSRLKLPELLGRTLHAGKQAGDFFSPSNPHAGQHRFSILLSNPPWREPEGEQTQLSYEVWLKSAGRTTVRRQIAGAYAHRAMDCVSADGRIVLILPISLLLASTSQRFIQNWLLYAQPEHVVNFGDLRRQMFPAANHGCAVVVARPRPAEELGRVPPEETFEYWTPKIDISLAFGRLTLYTGDRHRVQAQNWWEDNLILRTLAWGGREDVTLISRLALKGQLGDLKQTHGWEFIKGFHRSCRGWDPLPPGHLAEMSYLDARSIPREGPILPADALNRFPQEITSVVSYGSHEGRAFHGPRVLFPDGLSESLQMRAVFTNREVCFKHSICAICGQDGDEDLLRFTAAYLRSGLASYFILHTAFSPANERERIAVAEVRKFPFVHPEDHANRSMAWKIVRDVAKRSRAFERGQTQLFSASWPEAEVESLIADYFGLTQNDRALVRETIEWALPSRQESNDALLTPWQAPPSDATLREYAAELQLRLEQWRDARGGSGGFEVATKVGMRSSHRGIGVVEITLHPKSWRANPTMNEVGLAGIRALIEQLSRQKLLPMAVGENLFLSTDYLVLHEATAYLIKPLANRLWRPSQAARDARRLVEATGQGHRA